MNQLMLMQMFQSRGQLQTDSDALGGGEPLVTRDFVGKISRRVRLWINCLTRNLIITCLHRVIKALWIFIAPDVKDVNESWMRARNRHELFKSAKLTIIGRFGRQSISIDNLHC